MAEIAETVYETKKGKVVFNPEGLSNIEAGRVKNIALSVFHTLAEDAPYRLEICIFYADPGYDALSEEIEDDPLFVNPRIEGCDGNPFDQHYWLSCDLVRVNGSNDTVIFDPVFGYIGLEKEATKVLVDTYLRYYREKRRVKAWMSVGDGGVRIKRISI